jgi:hypothetical protein
MAPLVPLGEPIPTIHESDQNGSRRSLREILARWRASRRVSMFAPW